MSMTRLLLSFFFVSAMLTTQVLAETCKFNLKTMSELLLGLDIKEAEIPLSPLASLYILVKEANDKMKSGAFVQTDLDAFRTQFTRITHSSKNIDEAKHVSIESLVPERYPAVKNNQLQAAFRVLSDYGNRGTPRVVEYKENELRVTLTTNTTLNRLKMVHSGEAIRLTISSEEKEKVLFSIDFDFHVEPTLVKSIGPTIIFENVIGFAKQALELAQRSSPRGSMSGITWEALNEIQNLIVNKSFDMGAEGTALKEILVVLEHSLEQEFRKTYLNLHNQIAPAGIRAN